jgi:diguanylate cyclase (GGDEF)-like protein
MEGTPPGPSELVPREEVQRKLHLMALAALGYGLMLFAAGLAFGSPRMVAVGVLFWAYAVWVVAFPGRELIIRSRISPAAVVVFVVMVVAVVIEPFTAILAAVGLLIPIEISLPYSSAAKIRRLAFVTWVAAVAVGCAAFLPGDAAVPAVAANLMRLCGLVLIFGLVVSLICQSSERVEASGREFSRLFELTVDLAETTDPGALGNLVARHLAEATGFDDCVVYELAPEAGRLAPFGSHPAESALEMGPVPLAERPMLGRVLEDGAPIVIDIADVQADPAEQSHLRGLGRQAMLLLPLMARPEPVGVAELTSSEHHSVDERRLALASTLAFTAAMAIENGWLYQELRRRSLHDPLTGLANLSLFHDRVEHAFARLARREGAAVAVLFLDLDDFKAVNDTLGHAGGDALLALVAERLRAVVRPEDTAARLGGDEFALLLDEVASPAEALAVARRAVDAVAAPFEITGWSVRASVSIGVAYRSVDDSTVEEMIAEADAAMYEAKRAGKGRAVPFHPGLRNAPVTAGRPVAVAARSLAVAVAAAAVARAPGYAAADRAGGGGRRRDYERAGWVRFCVPGGGSRGRPF